LCTDAYVRQFEAVDSPGLYDIYTKPFTIAGITVSDSCHIF